MFHFGTNGSIIERCSYLNICALTAPRPILADEVPPQYHSAEFRLTRNKKLPYTSFLKTTSYHDIQQKQIYWKETGNRHMNVLFIYPELPPSFWSLPQATRFTTEKALYAPLGPITVAALLPREWDVRFVDFNVRELTEKDWVWSDIVMLSGMILQRSGFKLIIEEAKKRAKLTVAGGPYPTLIPNELIQAGCDFVVRGEAEDTIDLLVDSIKKGKSGQLIENTKKPDLSKTPIPRYDLIHPDNYLFFLLQTTRGCPFSCEFCDVAALYGNQPRHKSPYQVIAELEHLYQLGARGKVLIADDNFVADKKIAKAICREMIKWNRHRSEPFSFDTQASVNLGQDLEMIDLMTAANFDHVFIGIESLDEDILRANQKHHNVTNPLFESIENIKRNGLSIIGSFIIGFDNEKKGAGKRICDFVDQTDIPTIMPNILFALPGAKLWTRLEKEGRLLKEAADQFRGEATLSLPNFVPTRPLEEIMEEYIEMWEYLYHPPRVLERTYRYCLAVRPTRKAMAIGKGEKPPQSSDHASRPPLKRQIHETCILLHHVWIYGVLSSCRIQFWKQLIGMRRQNPSRLNKYIIHCIMNEDLIRMSKTIRHNINTLMKDRV